MKFLWISSLAWKSNGQYNGKVNTAGAVSGSLFEQNIIEGIEYHGHSVSIVNSFPYSDMKNHKGYYWSHNENSRDYCVNYNKNRYINLCFEYKKFKNYLRSISLDYDFVIIYLIHFPFLKLMRYIRKINKKIKFVLICPDLSDMMDLGITKFSFKYYLKKIEKKLLNKYYKFVDYFVLFSKYMEERIQIDNKPNIVIEGVNSIDEFRRYEIKDNPFVVLYAGSLQPNFGLENLIKAFDYIDDIDIELHIYGSGVLEEYIKSKCKNDNRIKFGGFVSHDEIKSKEKEASLLVNTRNPDALYTRYSFPSKTFEYIMSGTPFLTTKLAGIPDDYYEFIYTIDDNNPKTIAKKIISIRYEDKEKVKNMVENGEKYLLEKKNKIFQSKKLLDFIMGEKDV